MIYHIKKGLHGEIIVPGDKSISHRGVMLGAIASGTTEINNFLRGADCLSTIACFSKMGVEIEGTHDRILVHGNGLRGLKTPSQILDCGNSGTTTRLMSGILSAQSFTSTMVGDSSLKTRPMRRIIKPLSQMGANITSVLGNDCVPLRISGSPLTGIHYDSPVASAQVKSSILLAGLYAEGDTSVTEPALSRNHTELMLSAFGAKISSSGTTASVQGVKELYGQKIDVPGDISSAAYFLAAALIVPGSEVVLRNVGINHTRDGILTVCKQMGANLTYENLKISGEPCADIVVRHSELQGVTIEGEIIPRLIDELPMIAVLACFAKGTTIIRDAAELKVKESNRIRVIVDNLSAMGADIEETDDGMIIHGGRPLHGAVIDSHNDHRIAMSFSIAALNCEGEITITRKDCVSISYPRFYIDLKKLIRD
ncbi:3-phosphoshikimate 1-carboxyvinyltransferase [Hominifimenecus sp. rT4P-3]|uniref:3-phosphoshikimate 1-carboxyvinyltransferase n=1 Tax=Hominifimenecus sp. rT4P-3 TaxID=3242979 RepID=UPI003DA54A1E